MMYLGDFNVEDVITFPFTTHEADGGAVAPSSAFEADDIRIYRGSSATQRSVTDGVTMTSPFDSVTGLHMVSIDTSDNNDAGFYDAGYDYHVILVPDETVDGQTVVKVLATFSLENRFNEAAVISMADGIINSSTFAAGAITAGVIAADAIGASELAADAVAEIQSGLATASALTTVSTNVDTALTRLGTPSNLGSGATVAANLVDIEGQTDDIGVAGAGLTAVPWNASWDAEVQSEVNDGLVAVGLDHLVSASVTGTDVVDNSIIAKIVSKSATADWDSFVNTTDALEAQRDNIGTASNLGGGATIAANLSDIESQTDDIGAAGAGLTALATAANLATVDTVVDGIAAAIGTPSNLGGGATIAANLSDIESQTDDIGVAGIGLTALGSAINLSAVSANVASILADTGTDGVVISASTMNSIADAIFKRDLSAITGEAARSLLNAIRALRNKVAISGSTMTVYKEDDSTSAWTAAITSDANADPITAIDPT